ncbi:hypothetical protein FM106_01210 [Brachybacterium faecium]|nr:hypothetical protein FM106_01210 [Brachybacterium faecium]
MRIDLSVIVIILSISQLSIILRQLLIRHFDVYMDSILQ